MSESPESVSPQPLIHGRLYRLQPDSTGTLEIGGNVYPFGVFRNSGGVELHLQNDSGDTVALQPADEPLLFGRGVDIGGVELIQHVPGKTDRISQAQLSIRQAKDGIVIRNVGNAWAAVHGGQVLDVTERYEIAVVESDSPTVLTPGRHFVVRPNNDGGVVARISLPNGRVEEITQDVPHEGFPGLLRVHPIGVSPGDIVTVGWQGLHSSQSGLQRGRSHDDGMEVGIYSWSASTLPGQPHDGLELVASASDVTIEVEQASLVQPMLGSVTVERGTAHGVYL